MRRCKHWAHKIFSENICLKTCSTSFSTEHRVPHSFSEKPQSIRSSWEPCRAACPHSLPKFGLCLPVTNTNAEAEFGVKEKKIALLLCQAKISTLPSFWGCWSAAVMVVHDLIHVEADGRCWSPVLGAPSRSYIRPQCGGGGHCMTFPSRGARNAHSQVWQRFPWEATQCDIIGLGQKSPDPPCLTSLWWSRNILPLVASSHI